MEKSTKPINYEALAQLNKDTRESIRGTRNYQAGQATGNVIPPKPDTGPIEQYDWRDVDNS